MVCPSTIHKILRSYENEKVNSNGNGNNEYNVDGIDRNDIGQDTKGN